MGVHRRRMRPIYDVQAEPAGDFELIRWWPYPQLRYESQGDFKNGVDADRGSAPLLFLSSTYPEHRRWSLRDFGPRTLCGYSRNSRLSCLPWLVDAGTAVLPHSRVTYSELPLATTEAHHARDLPTLTESPRSFTEPGSGQDLWSHLATFTASARCMAQSESLCGSSDEQYFQAMVGMVLQPGEGVRESVSVSAITSAEGFAVSFLTFESWVVHRTNRWAEHC